MSVGSNDRRVSKKAHKCEECSRTIPKGAAYHYITGLFDGSWWTAKLCARCQRAWDRANDRGALIGTHPEDGPSFGELAGWLKEWRHKALWLVAAGAKVAPIEAVRKRKARRLYFASMHAARREAR